MDEYRLTDLLNVCNSKSENEILELKEAKDHFKVQELGRYFSALSNEANLHSAPYAVLFFGVTDDGEVCGTRFRQEDTYPSKGLQRLKREIAEGTNNRITFRDIVEFDYEGKRVIGFIIPPATSGIPTQWAGAAWAREGESLVPLPINKIDEIRSQPPRDWSRETISDATLEDLDPRAIALVREKLREQYGDRESLIDHMSDSEMLDKVGITFCGQITNTALLLLGKENRSNLMAGAIPTITWSLYESSGVVRTYQHFMPPFLLAIDEILKKVRNEEVRLLADPMSLLPMTTREYDDWSLRELIGNAIAHQDYRSGGKVNIEEFAGELVFLNEGGFIPETLERALSKGYKPPYYRNPFLVTAMLQIGMLDQNAMGIRTVCDKAQKRFMPLPSYDLSDPARVKIALPNHEINSAYTHILFENRDLPILTVLSLDKFQKGFPLDKAELEDLYERGFVKEGEKGWHLVDPASNRPAEEKNNTPQISETVMMTPRDRRVLLKSEILRIVKEHPGLSTPQIVGLLLSKPNLETEQLISNLNNSKVLYLLKKMEEQGLVKGEGNTRAKTWWSVKPESEWQ